MIVIIDGNNVIFRAYFAIKDLKTSYGFPTNAVYGSLKCLRGIINNLKPDYILVCFDSGKKSFRNEIDPNYKAQRPPVSDDLKAQFAVVQEAFRLLGIPQITAPVGMEGDDIVGSIATRASEANMEAIIASSDKDFFSLINDNIKVYSFNVAKKDGESGIVDYNYVMEKFGVRPDQLVHVKALTGERGDNIQGVKGIGLKTATALIQEHGTVTALLEHLKKNKTHKNFIIYENIDIVKKALELAIIKTDIKIQEVPVKPVDTITIDSEALKEFFIKYEMNQCLSEFRIWNNLFQYKTSV